MSRPDVVLIDGARTPFGAFGGSLKDVTATDLGAIAARGALQRASVKPEQIDNVVFGSVIDSSEDAPYLARHIALKAGVPQGVPALKVGRACGSGLQAIVSAAQSMLLGESEIALAGGAENMSQVPFVLRNARFGLPFGQNAQLEDALMQGLTDSYVGLGMALTAENLAERYRISREESDRFAYESQVRAREAQESGRLGDEIVPVPIRDRRGNEVLFERDEHLRPDTTLEQLGKLKARFKSGGIVTPGSASGINDGAAAVVVATAEAARRAGLKPLVRLVSWGVAGVDPSVMGIGPAPSARQALERAGLSLDQIDLFEVNEAFAPQYLAVEKELGLDRSRVNVNGGAIAIGHPVGASGARLGITTAYELRRRKARYGLASLCIGGGQGIAAIFENLQR